MPSVFSLGCNACCHAFLDRAYNPADCVARYIGTCVSNFLFEVCDAEGLDKIHFGFHVSPKEENLWASGLAILEAETWARYVQSTYFIKAVLCRCRSIVLEPCFSQVLVVTSEIAKDFHERLPSLKVDRQTGLRTIHTTH